MPASRTPHDLTEQFACPTCSSFAFHTGNIKARDGQSAKNAIGGVENALVLMETVKMLLADGITHQTRQIAESVVAAMGDIEGMRVSVQHIRAEQATQTSPIQLGSALRNLYFASGDSESSASIVDATPAPDGFA
ncbi:hypothetical protein FBEOM_1114 [Fusarium beomiforme]|uniref:Uncharacterized protein n=1 Tax=Fusarium beomiforme TaxID=44412 RepID=A0A9P5AU99_9HYPO|nr:hypothetical protein FBEOM_1114 [Fusarium beomiforme]